MKSVVKNLLVYGLLTMLSAPAQAIVNVEQAIIGQPKEGLQNRLDFLASGATGNSDQESAKANMLNLWKHDTHTDFLQLQYAYGKSNGETDTDRAFAHARHRTAVTPVWAAEAYAQVGRDTFARMMQRIIIGTGVRWTLYKENEKYAGYFGLGIFHEKEILNDRLGTNDPIHSTLTRANAYLVLKRKVNEQVRLYNTTYYQPATANTSDYRVLEEASVLVKMAENLDFKISLEIAYDSKPPQTVQKRDLYYSSGLEFSF